MNRMYQCKKTCIHTQVIKKFTVSRLRKKSKSKKRQDNTTSKVRKFVFRCLKHRKYDMSVHPVKTFFVVKGVLETLIH